MTFVQMKTVAGQSYIAGPEGLHLWIVCKHWPTGKIDRVAAYFTESIARAHAGDLVGKDNATIGLETIPVMDTPAGGK